MNSHSTLPSTGVAVTSAFSHDIEPSFDILRPARDEHKVKMLHVYTIDVYSKHRYFCVTGFAVFQ